MCLFPQSCIWSYIFRSMVLLWHILKIRKWSATTEPILWFNMITNTLHDSNLLQLHNIISWTKLDLLLLLLFDTGGCPANHRMFNTDVSRRFYVRPKRDLNLLRKIRAHIKIYFCINAHSSNITENFFDCIIKQNIASGHGLAFGWYQTERACVFCSHLLTFQLCNGLSRK